VPVSVNQQANGGAWTTLGTWAFNAGATTITLNDQADGYVIADAVKFEPEGALPESASWSPALTTPARYDVYARWTALANRTAQAKYVITHQGGTATVTQSQQANGATWNLLGTWTFAPGQGVRLEAADDGYAIADAIRFTPTAEQPTLGGLAYVHPDHLGTPRAITRPSDNALLWRWENAEPFGDSQPNENPSGLGAFAYNLRFPGQYFDQETGTHYNYFRDYDPAVGRYVESDPLGLLAGANTYHYSSSNPLGRSDFFGLKDCGTDNFWGKYVIPDNPFWLPFQKCCKGHDRCYDDPCNIGSIKADCDGRFCRCMTDKCKNLTGAIRWLCDLSAATYFTAVDRGAAGAYLRARDR
jgi:RHS repeat-associated protein